MLISGKEIAKKVKAEIVKKIEEIKIQYKEDIGISCVFIGNNESSLSYVNSQKRLCEELGVRFSLETLKEDCQEKEVLSLIENLNNDTNTNGIIVLTPLPKHISFQRVISNITPEKDIEGIHPYNIGLLSSGTAQFVSPTALAAWETLKSTNTELQNKKAVIVGRSLIVGRPLLFLLLNIKKSATVTVCHSATNDLFSFTKQADILFVAIGKPLYIKSEAVKEGAIVIDIGTNWVNDRLVGDVAFDEVKDKASFITPVPGGVGSITSYMLIVNLIKAYKLQKTAK